MIKSSGRFSFFIASCLFCYLTLLLAPGAFSQQTLGGITGTVTDPSGGALTDSEVTLVADGTKLTRTQKTNNVGSYEFVNLPIGTYTLTFTQEGFVTLKVPSIPVQADRTATVNATLKVGQVGTTVTVEASPLMDSADITNGYILERDQIEAIPLPTGSFTALAILSPGVNSELSSGTGASSGLGNQPIWAASCRLLHPSAVGTWRFGRCHSFQRPLRNQLHHRTAQYFPYYNGFPTVGTPALPTACSGSNTGFYNCPFGLGTVNKTIGSARQIQFSLHLQS